MVPVHNGGREFQDCLDSLAQYRDQFEELIVVNDGSTDDSLERATAAGARVLSIDSRRGPSRGRNAGALSATGDIVLFLDADVCVGPETIPRIRRRFDEEPALGAVFGSYDSEPSAPGLVSQFRNLLHCFVHQTSKRRASTFWAGCGAMRRTVFQASGGFHPDYSTACVEDLELGMRLNRAGVEIALDPAIQVKHLKQWTAGQMIATDIWQRGVPWTQLILNSRCMPNDLNLRSSARASVALTALIGLQASILALAPARGLHANVTGPALVLLAAAASVLLLNNAFYRFLSDRRGFRFAVVCFPLHLIHFFCCGLAFVFGCAAYCWQSLGVSAASRPLPDSRGAED